MKSITKPHIQSYDYAMDKCLAKACIYMPSVEIKPPEASSIPAMTLWYENFQWVKPEIDGNKVMPSECRLRNMTYSTSLMATICRKMEGSDIDRINVEFKDIPIMVDTAYCNIRGMSSQQLIKEHEEAAEMGGYFLIHGIERIIRMLIVMRRNYPIAFQRASFMTRTKNMTPYAVQIRCVRDDLVSQTLSIHYLSDGNCMLKIICKKQEFLIPVYIFLKAFTNASDEQIYNKLVKGSFANRNIGDRVEILLQEGQSLSLKTASLCMSYLGSRFKPILGMNPSMSDFEVGEAFIREYILIHCKTDAEKFDCICIMLEKLYALVDNEIDNDNLDSTVNHEIMLPGHIYANLLAEKLKEAMIVVRSKILKETTKANPRDLNYIKKLFASQTSVGRKMEYFLATGNLMSSTNLDLQQTAGFTIVADRLNFLRYLSHFRSIHRGQYFSEMKTTTVRKLLPDSWGFLCPVHTPDGAPCGLLNHISHTCDPCTSNIELFKEIKEVCSKSGMVSPNIIYQNNYIHVMLDGIVIGFIPADEAQIFESTIREHKAANNLNVELVSIPKKEGRSRQYYGIYIFTQEGRFMRKVWNLGLKKEEWIGPLEQIYLNIGVYEKEITPAHTHQELDPSNILSILASSIPFLEYNQSPRNMYQCQMGKQTMGIHAHNYPYRNDNKSYRLIYPQSPIVKSNTYTKFELDEYPTGTNAVVAVIAYTGYDMEDAMILNKSSYERGFAHGCIYKSVAKPLNEEKKKSSRFRMINKKYDKTVQLAPTLDNDGLALVGQYLTHGTVDMCTFDQVKQEPKLHSFKDNENAYLDSVRIYPDGENQTEITYTLRFTRNPVIGDKFSSRHGQKGVLSMLWPQIDMPFTESGITPDVIINPNAFPSRMTIGMLIEAMAGKSGSIHGTYQDFNAFQSFQNDSAVDYFGNELKKAGYNFYGTETMYSGISGVQFKVDIYLGVVYYQRLRHMVSDKSQARSTGPIDILTRQPIKGRKHHGGIRFGEMERDSLIAHGVAGALRDRLMMSSDYSEGYLCSVCGSLLGPCPNLTIEGEIQQLAIKQKTQCKQCGSNDCRKVAIPYVLRYLVNELAAMNVKLKFNFSEDEM